MSNRANYLKIGIFVITGTLVALGLVIVLGAGAILREEIPVESYFEDSVQGLDVGSPVKFRGVQIGKVDKIGLVSQEYDTRRRYVLVRMALFSDDILGRKKEKGKSELAELIAQGLRVRLNYQGVTGTAYVEADYLEPGRYPQQEFEWEPDYPYIPSAPSIIARLTESLDKIMRNLEQINMEELSNSLQGSLESVTQAFEKANVAALGAEAEKLLQEMRETNREIKTLVQQVEVKPLLSEASLTLQETRQMVDEIRPVLGRFLETGLAATEKIDRMAGRMEQSGDLAASLERLQRAARRLDNLMADQGAELDEIVRNFRILSENLRRVSEELERNPRTFLFGDPPPPTEIGGQ